MRVTISGSWSEVLAAHLCAISKLPRVLGQHPTLAGAAMGGDDDNVRALFGLQQHTASAAATAVECLDGTLAVAELQCDGVIFPHRTDGGADREGQVSRGQSPRVFPKFPRRAALALHGGKPLRLKYGVAAVVAIIGDDLYENIQWGSETPIPDATLLAQDNAIAADQSAIAAAISAALAEKQAVQGDAFVAQFVGMTPQQVAAYVAANVTDLASAKTLLGKVCVMLLLLAKREYK